MYCSSRTVGSCTSMSARTDDGPSRRFRPRRRGGASLLCDDAVLATGEMQGMWPAGPTAGGVCCGYNEASPVSDRYVRPYAFTGAIHDVVVESADDFANDPALATHMALAED